jgi:hypothetical protein
MSKQDETPPAPPAKTSASSDPKAQLAAATRKDGILALNPKGDLVRLRPGSIRLAASVEKGLYLEGLKDGWRLATDADLKDKSKAGIEGEKANPRGGASPKAGGA